MSKKTTVINLFGGPGSGKTTVSLGVAYELKKREMNIELVREYVKKWAWQGILPNDLDQMYITGKQTKAEHMLYGKVDTVVTDCPLMMGPFYEQKYCGTDVVLPAIKQFIQLTSENVVRLDFMVSRSKKYISEGRFCSEESARQTDVELRAYLKAHGFNPVQLEGTIAEQVQTILRIGCGL